jgi:transposase
MAKRVLKPVFETYAQNQTMLLPPSLEELIAANHPVRIVNTVLDSLDIEPLLKKYKGGGTSSYHPRMLLKVLVYAYISNIYSSRKIEEACRINIHFMWLCAMQPPDHNTINRFRGERLKEVLRRIFTQVVQLLAAEGLLSLKEVYVDGTKIESVANRYTFVWGNAIKTNREKIGKQLEELWQYAQSIAAEEMDGPEPPDFTDISPETVKATVEKIDAALREKPEADKKITAKLTRVKKDWPGNMEKYAVQEQILDGRNSYSKTDPDATFMRMKDDHMGGGQLKPGYNVQISSSNQYVVDYSIHPNPTDTITLIPHLARIKEDFGVLPEVITADAGYGSEENYEHLEGAGIEAYVKYSYFDKDQHEAERSKRPFTQDKLHYNKEHDHFICPMGQVMENIGTVTKKTVTGFKQTITRYGVKTCEGCPLRGACHKGEGARVIEVNHNLNRHKQEAHGRLTSERGLYHRKKRPVDVEPVFGNVKQNHGFRRFLLRGNEKVEIETGLLFMAQNLRRKAAENLRKAA